LIVGDFDGLQHAFWFNDQAPSVARPSATQPLITELGNAAPANVRQILLAALSHLQQNMRPQASWPWPVSGDAWNG
jgi:hypothetical protein